MKKVLLSILILALSASFAVAQSGPAAVKSGLLKLESNIKWSAVSTAWRGQRGPWISNVKNANSAARAGKLLAQLESNIKWSAVSSRWKSLRSGWVSRCRSAASARQVAKLLLTLESNVKWSAVSSRWRSLRSGWISGLRNIQ